MCMNINKIIITFKRFTDNYYFAKKLFLQVFTTFSMPHMNSFLINFVLNTRRKIPLFENSK